MDTGVAATTRRHARLLALAGIAGIALVVLVVAFLEGDFGEEFGDVAGFAGYLTRRFGVPASLLLLYVEETGIPLPVPGDVYVVYLGSAARNSAIALAGAWMAVVLAVTAGSTNLYLISRRWGHRLVANRFAHVLHLDQGRLEQVEGWFGRWGAVAIIFGRHIPGFRIPVTVMSGIFEVRYRVFAPSVAVSTGVWAAVWIWLGSRYGVAVVHTLGRHTWIYAVVAAAVAIAVGVIGVRVLRAASTPGADTPVRGRTLPDHRPAPTVETMDEDSPDRQDYEAREEHVAQGHRPEDAGGSEETEERPDQEHPADARGG